MKKHDNCECARGGSFPLHGDGFSRRRFMRLAGTGLVASYFAPVLNARLLQDAKSVKPSLRNSAKNCILIFLSGAPSHVDTWDLKEGAWTPSVFNPTSYGAIRFPQGLMPNTASHLDKVCIVRSGLAWAAVHPLAQAWVQISRNPSGVTGSISPHIGAVVALESQLNRKPGDVLPAFVSINQLMAGSGYLPARYAPFPVTPSQDGLPTLTHPDGVARFADRWNLIQKIDGDRATGNLGRNASDMSTFSDQAKELYDTPGLAKTFSYTNEEFARYGGTDFGGSLVVARNLIGAQRGTRFVQVTLSGWDNHSNIYALNAGIFKPMKSFDPGFGALLTDLAASPGTSTGKTLLDETLIVVIGEFGRTVGALNTQAGRDHFQRMSIAFAGGGVQGGRAIGATDSTGSNATEFGALGRDTRPEDVASTIYSALGIDYTTVRHDDPLGRGFEYVPLAKDGTYGPIEEVFG
jgi:ribosomal protein L27